jgi:hypothetical protein
MKFEVTHPKIWSKLAEKSIPMKNRIKIYEKMGGAYRLGEDRGEQVFNKMTELLKYKMQETDSGGDHEVGMAMSQLADIMKNATELKGKIGTQEKNLPGWITDHISQAMQFINQANTGYHELGDNEEK